MVFQFRSHFTFVGEFFFIVFVAVSSQMAICFLINLVSWLLVVSFSHNIFPFDFVDIDTRRRAACDLVRGLCKFFEGPVTGIFSGYVNSMLQEYAKNPSVNWKHKDAAIYLVTSLASKAQTQKVNPFSIFLFLKHSCWYHRSQKEVIYFWLYSLLC